MNQVRETFSPLMSASNTYLRFHLIREADPDGRAVLHRIVRNHRLIDWMLQEGKLTPLRHEAATQLRDDYELAGPRLADASAAALDTRVSGGSSPADLVADEDAWKRYCGAMRACCKYWWAIRPTVIEDRAVVSPFSLWWGLDDLSKHYGLA